MYSCICKVSPHYIVVLSNNSHTHINLKLLKCFLVHSCIHFIAKNTCLMTFVLICNNFTSAKMYLFIFSHILINHAHHVVSLYKDSRTYGVPSVRADLPAPRIKRVSDTNNYGDSSTAGDLLHPSVHALQGVHEKHFFLPRTKKEVGTILYLKINCE